jgi:hypothetical protein
MEYLIDKKTAKETEGKKQNSLREVLDEMIEEALKSGHYATKMPAFFLQTFMKFTPEQDRAVFSEKEGRYVLKNHRLNYNIRGAMPLPFWGTNLYIVKSGEKKHKCLWSLPQLARNSPLYTYQRAVKSGRPKFETDSILRMINGELEALTWKYNTDHDIEKIGLKMVKNGTIPLLKANRFAPATEAYLPVVS